MEQGRGAGVPGDVVHIGGLVSEGFWSCGILDRPSHFMYICTINTSPFFINNDSPFCRTPVGVIIT